MSLSNSTYHSNKTIEFFLFSSEKTISKKACYDFLYEKENHLGNVHVVISDRKLPVDDGVYDSNGNQTSTTPDGIFDYYEPDVVFAADYYAGVGMVMPGRLFVTEDHRYGAQGSEVDQEIDGTRDRITTYYRQGNLKTMRWDSPDPKAALMPWQSPYAMFNNNPVSLNDPMGDCPPGVDCDDPVDNPEVAPTDINGKKGGLFGMGRGKHHAGLDILAPKGADLRAVLPGKVVYAKNNHESDEYSVSGKSPTSGYGNAIVIEYTIESDFSVEGKNGKQVQLKKGQKVYIRYTHMDKVDESLLGKKVNKGDILGQAGATGNPGLKSSGKYGIKIENRHTHFEVGTTMTKTGYIESSSNVNPNIFMKTQFDDNGEAIPTNDYKEIPPFDGGLEGEVNPY